MPGWRRTLLLLIATLVAGLAPSGAAFAQGDPDGEDEPSIEKRPRVAGTPVVGETLTAIGAEWEGGPTVVLYVWIRCRDARGRECQEARRGPEAGYRLEPADEGRYLSVGLVVANRGGVDQALSRNVLGPVAAARPPAPAPAPEPAPAPAPAPAPPAEPAPAPQAAPPVAVAPRLIEPFPVVRIVGRVLGRGVRVSRLSVRAPRDARILVRCEGRSCPRATTYRSRANTRLRRFERYLAAGTRLSVRVTSGDAVGKHTLFLVRRGRPPERSDRCLPPGQRRPVACTTLLGG